MSITVALVLSYGNVDSMTAPQPTRIPTFAPLLTPRPKCAPRWREYQLIVLVSFLCGTALPLDAQVRTNQHAFALQMLGTDEAKRDQALTEAQRLGPERLGPEVRRAMITLLERGHE